jgi:hypothetical protein
MGSVAEVEKGSLIGSPRQIPLGDGARGAKSFGTTTFFDSLRRSKYNSSIKHRLEVQST